MALTRTMKIGVIAVGEEHPREALAAALRGRGLAARNAAVVVALGPRWCQLRRLRGLPRLLDQRLARAAMRENVARFFLRKWETMTTSGVEWTADGEGAGWSVACDATLVAALADACRQAGARLRAVVPFERFSGWSEDQVGGIPSTHPLAITPEDAGQAGGWQDHALLAALAVSALFCWVSPSLAPEPASAAVAGDPAETNAVPLTVVIARIMAALPPSTRVTSVRVDPATAEVQFMAPRTDVVLRSLDSLPGTGAAEIVGTIFPVGSGEQRQERARLRLGIVHDARRWNAEGDIRGATAGVVAPSRAQAEVKVAESLSDAAARRMLRLGGLEFLRAPSGGQSTIRVRSTVRGSFPAFLQFLAHIETLEPRLRVRHLSIRAESVVSPGLAATAGIEADFAVEANASIAGRG